MFINSLQHYITNSYDNVQVLPTFWLQILICLTFPLKSFIVDSTVVKMASLLHTINGFTINCIRERVVDRIFFGIQIQFTYCHHRRYHMHSHLVVVWSIQRYPEGQAGHLPQYGHPPQCWAVVGQFPQPGRMVRCVYWGSLAPLVAPTVQMQPFVTEYQI